MIGSMAQLLLFADPRPLVERLGTDFFRSVPEEPGVYLMRDSANTVVYVGKAKNLRKRLGSYRVANPERMRTRHLKLLHAVDRIEIQTCASEAAALAKESELLRNLRPQFNRAGTWPGSPKFVGWRLVNSSLEFSVLPAKQVGWNVYGPLGYSALLLRSALARLLWQALQPQHSWADLPQGWHRVAQRGLLRIPCATFPPDTVKHSSSFLEMLFAGELAGFTEWILQRTAGCVHPFEMAVRDQDLETVADLVSSSAMRDGADAG
jgi:predicted GIY-YIG superfamily endonuclease